MNYRSALVALLFVILSPVSAQTNRGAEAFEGIVPVLRHPRCMNCHSAGDYPRQGDDRHRHTMDVRRGPEGKGANAVKCSTCHQESNVPGLHTPPGAEDWHLPSPAMPMVWEGLSDRKLCELLKDPNQNGHRSVQQIVEHMSTPLVRWGWHPGEGRTPIPVPEERFLAGVKSWAARSDVPTLGLACERFGPLRFDRQRFHPAGRKDQRRNQTAESGKG